MPYVHGVSVVLATHNGSKFIRKQLETLVDQTVPPLEIIVSDDASTDDTLQIIRKFASASAVEFKIVENIPPLGFRDNFLRAALSARGSLVAFCDQDDIWDTRKIDYCVDAHTLTFARTIKTKGKERGGRGRERGG